MLNQDTIYLLRECNKGTQMAVYSINEILENVRDLKLISLLSDSKALHEKLGNELHALLTEYGDEPKDPGAMAKGMSWFKTNTKLMLADSDRTCADLITEGCNMGIKSIHHYMNQYSAADDTARKKANALVEIEEKLARNLREFL